MAYTTPARLNSWLEAGLQAHQQGDIERALGAYRQVLAAAPDHPAALRLLGTGLLQLGEAREAAAYLERAARRQSRDAQLLANLAQAYLALSRYAEAAQTFRKASRLAPNEAQFHVGAAAALAMEGRLDEAESALQRHAVRFPNAPLVWLNLANVLRDRQRFDASMEAYRRALALDPRMVDARNNLGRVLHMLLRFAEAEKEYRACIEVAPDFLIARHNLASVTMDRGHFAESETVCRQIVALEPDLADAHRLLGSALGFQGRLIDALACYRRAAGMAPDDPQTVQAYGTALMEAGHSPAGLRWLAHAATLMPDTTGLKQALANALLAHGALADGWANYADRPGSIDLRSNRYSRLQCAQALPEHLAGAHVCVLAEQGLGDQLFFLRYVGALAGRGARVSYGPSGKLHGLMQRVPALDRVFATTDEVPQADLYVLAGDLPRMLHVPPASALRDAGPRPDGKPASADFERRIEVFWPAPAPTLSIPALPERLSSMREQLAALGPPPYIGVTWRGGTAPEKQQAAAWLLFKSIGLPALGGVLRDLPGTFIALQRKPDPSELDSLSAELGRPVHDLSALNNELEDMQALLALLDEYVGVSNTNMHMRAAAGRTARVLVPAPAEWRWMQSGRQSPWFPDFHIYRQSLRGDWSPALAALKRDLEASWRQP